MSRENVESVIVRWEVEPLHRPRRGFDELLFLAAPRLVRRLVSLAAHDRPGSLLRRVVLGRFVGGGIAAVNRGDYELLTGGVSPAVEVNLLPDAPDARPLDVEQIYRGREDYLKLAEIWKADFDDVRFELRELVDQGGDRIGARGDRVGRGGRSGVNVRDTDFYVWQFERGQVRRQWILHTEAAMLAMLERDQDVRPRTQQLRPPT